MSLPRAIVPGRRYMITRRCSERRFFMRPGRETNNAGFAQQFGVDAMIMGENRGNCRARANCRAKPPDVGPVKQISTGRDAEAGIPRGCAVRENGELVCWGPAFCADGSALCGGWAWNQMETLLDGVKQVSVGGYLACAVRNGGDVWCWGRADGGGLGGESAGAERASRVDLIHLGR